MAGVTVGSLASVKHAPAQTPVADGAPANMISFFATGDACPAGWVEVDNLRGRTPVGVPTDMLGQLGVSSGAALSAGEDPGHLHTYAASIDLGSKGVAAAGGSNTDGANPGVVNINETTSASSFNIPYVQLRACSRQ